MKAQVTKHWGNARAVVSLFLPASASPFFSNLKKSSFKKKVKCAVLPSTKAVVAAAAGAVVRASLGSVTRVAGAALPLVRSAAPGPQWGP